MKKIINYIEKNRKNILFLITSILFICLTYFILSDKITPIDETIHSIILNIRNKNLTSILLIITNLGSSYTLIILSILLIVIMKNKKIPICISLNLICSFLISQFAKILFARTRPVGINLIDEAGFSYPSGHAMVSMAYYGFIAYLIYKSETKKINKIILIILLTITIITIGFSRIYLGVHYLSDVVGGFLLSIAYLMIYIKNIKLEKK